MLEIQHDLRDARALLEKSGTKDETKKYRKAAEIILLKSLNANPANEEAKALLHHARAVTDSTDVPPRSWELKESRDSRESRERELREWKEPKAPWGQEEIPFTAAPSVFERKEEKKPRAKLPLTMVGIIVLIGGLVIAVQAKRSHPKALAGSVAAETQPANVKDFQPGRSEGTANATLPVVDIPAPAPVPTATSNPPAPVVTTPANPVVTPAPAPVPPPSDMGKLAVSSPTAADVYMNGKYLASTPATLQLPVGNQTLEYRHGNLRNVVNHQIKPNETTTASVTFQLTTQINARPWAQVFLDGPTRKPLGQTPLSGVTVPIGGVLVFENPGFTTKTYRITEADTAIQVNFQ